MAILCKTWSSNHDLLLRHPWLHDSHIRRVLHSSTLARVRFPAGVRARLRPLHEPRGHLERASSLAIRRARYGNVDRDGECVVVWANKVLRCGRGRTALAKRIVDSAQQARPLRLHHRIRLMLR
jgi:hypothetical protein